MLRGSFLAALGHWALVAVLRMKVVVYMTAKVGGAVKPRASANKDTAGKPLGAVVTVGSAAIGGRVIVSVGTFRSCADFDANLGLCFGSAYGEAETGDGGQS